MSPEWVMCMSIKSNCVCIEELTLKVSVNKDAINQEICFKTSSNYHQRGPKSQVQLHILPNTKDNHSYAYITKDNHSMLTYTLTYT